LVISGMGRRRRGRGAVVATDTASADADYDNGAALRSMSRSGFMHRGRGAQEGELALLGEHGVVWRVGELMPEDLTVEA
jgi:hypothetical protein